jgi:hypothetical protein
MPTRKVSAPVLIKKVYALTKKTKKKQKTRKSENGNSDEPESAHLQYSLAIM